MFVHIPSYSELIVDGKVVNDDSTANEAMQALMPKVTRAPQSIEMPLTLWQLSTNFPRTTNL